MRAIKLILLAMLAASGSVPLGAKIVPSALFSDHAVLQRDKPIYVWGEASSAEEVTVSFAGQSHTTRTGPNGHWQITLTPLAANAEPAIMTITGENTLEVKDIYHRTQPHGRPGSDLERQPLSRGDDDEHNSGESALRRCHQQ
jgi:hypothetical protein